MLHDFQYEEWLFLFWMFLLLPWFPLAFAIGMALDGGPTFGAYALIASVWTYPISVWAVWKFREIHPRIAFLPLVHIIPLIIFG